MNTTKKRRVIYMTDDEWSGIKEEAQGYGMSISALLRARAAGAPPVIDVAESLFAAAWAERPASLAIQQAERDRILNAVNRKGSGA